MKGRKEGGFEGSGGSLQDNTNKKQHHEKPMGYEGVASMAASHSRKEAKPAADGSNSNNIGHGEARAKAARMGGSQVGGSGQDNMGQDSDRTNSGAAATARAGQGGGRMPGVGEKASGYRDNHDPMPTNKAKRQGGSY
jgi:hypothetical protein